MLIFLVWIARILIIWKRPKSSLSLLPSNHQIYQSEPQTDLRKSLWELNTEPDACREQYATLFPFVNTGHINGLARVNEINGVPYIQNRHETKKIQIALKTWDFVGGNSEGCLPDYSTAYCTPDPEHQGWRVVFTKALLCLSSYLGLY